MEPSRIDRGGHYTIAAQAIKLANGLFEAAFVIFEVDGMTERVAEERTGLLYPAQDDAWESAFTAGQVWIERHRPK